MLRPTSGGTYTSLNWSIDGGRMTSYTEIICGHEDKTAALPLRSEQLATQGAAAYIVMAEVLEQLDFAQRAQTEHAVVKRHDALDGNLLAGRLVQRRATAWGAAWSARAAITAASELGGWPYTTVP